MRTATRKTTTATGRPIVKVVKNILVIRNDKLGDFMLAWPAFALLKKQYPQAVITALVPSYTKAMAELCPSIDKIVIDSPDKSTLSGAIDLARILKHENFDAVVSLYTEARTALACFLARIPQRIAPATKIAQIFSNHKLSQHRSRSEKPEYEYNIDLIKFFIRIQGGNETIFPAPPYLEFEQNEISSIRQTYIQENKVGKNLLIIIHPGTGGSAINLSLDQYADLLSEITKTVSAHVIITAGPGEVDTAEELSLKLANTEHSVYISKGGLKNFCRFIATCDLFISGSTGPLHIAGALNMRTAAFYPARRSATSLRWQTINQADKRISFSPERYNGIDDMKTISMPNCADKIISFISDACP